MSWRETLGLGPDIEIPNAQNTQYAQYSPDAGHFADIANSANRSDDRGTEQLPAYPKFSAEDKLPQQLPKKYGFDLACVRYRYDPVRGLRYITAEVAEQITLWDVRNNRHPGPDSPRPAPTDRFGVRIDYGELDLRRKVKALGGTWQHEIKLWELPFAAIEELGIEARIDKILQPIDFER